MTNASQTVPSQLDQSAAPRNQIAYNSIPGTQNTGPNLNLSSLGGQNGLLTQGLSNLFAPGSPVQPQQPSSGNYGLPSYGQPAIQSLMPYTQNSAAGQPGGYVPTQQSVNGALNNIFPYTGNY